MTRDTAARATIEHVIGPAGRLSVKVSSWDLQLTAGPDDMVRIRDAEGAPLPGGIEIDRGSTSLSIRQPGNFLGGLVFGTDRSDRKLAIEVPAGAAVEVQTASGDVTADGINGEQSFRSASGDLRVREAGGDVTTETVSGDISLHIVGSVELAVKTVSGDVVVDGGRLERLRLATTSGDVRLTSELGAGPHAVATVSGDVILYSNRGLRIAATTVAGDLRTDLPHTSSGGPGRRALVIGDGETELQFRSVSGDLRVVDPAAAGSGTVPVAPLADARPVHVPDLPNEVEATRLDILRALEAGEIDVAQATDRLAALDGLADV